MLCATFTAGAVAAGGIPFEPAPPGCNVYTAAASNSQVINIPATPPPLVFTTTVDIQGLPSHFWDAVFTMSLTHTYCSDLDITLTSPAGTSVTITSDNAEGLADVFANSAFFVGADPDGVVPFDTNANSVSDHPWVNNQTATPLTPEESFAAFRGENPNGTWTLTVSDDAVGDGGVLSGWTLDVVAIDRAPDAATNSFFSFDPFDIIGAPLVFTRTIEVAGLDFWICDVNAGIDVLHFAPSDLDITLTSPSGTSVTLTSDNGHNAEVDAFSPVVFDDSADPDGIAPYATNAGLVNDHPYADGVPPGTLVPEEPLAAFTGEDPNGTWTLTVSDDELFFSGVFNAWTLELSTCVCADPPTCPADLNGDGLVDGADLGAMLSAWGGPGADLDGNGTTDGGDLGQLLSAWGGCPT